MNGMDRSTGPIEIRDLDDLRVAQYRDSRDADLRGRHGLFLVESEACIRRWLGGVAQRRAGNRPTPSLGVESLLLSHEAFGRLADAIEAAGEVRTYVAEASIVERIAGYDHHHGAIGLGRRAADDGADLAAFLDATERPSTVGDARPTALSRAVVVTDGVVHVDNMGSIFRNAAALGAAGVLVSSRCADPLVRKTIRISMGHVFAVPWATVRDLPAALRELRARGWRVVAAENTPDAVDVIDLDRTTFDRRSAVVFGAEGHGISPAVMAEAETVVRVPSREGVPLNVAVASAIVLHELGRAERNRSARGG